MSKHKPHSPSWITDPPALEDKLLDEYGADLDDHELSEDQKKEFLLSLWKIMVAFVDLGFDLGPVPSKTGDNAAQIFLEWQASVLHLTHPEDTAHETVAPLATTQKEEHS